MYDELDNKFWRKQNEKSQLFIGYIGTYTKGTSKGIYSFQLNTQTKTISEPTLVAELH